jgi:hypothetical protein
MRGQGLTELTTESKDRKKERKVIENKTHTDSKCVERKKLFCIILHTLFFFRYQHYTLEG